MRNAGLRLAVRSHYHITPILAITSSTDRSEEASFIGRAFRARAQFPTAADLNEVSGDVRDEITDDGRLAIFCAPYKRRKKYWDLVPVSKGLSFPLYGFRLPGRSTV